MGFSEKEIGQEVISNDLPSLAPPKIRFSNQFKQDLKKIYSLKPFLEVQMVDSLSR